MDESFGGPLEDYVKANLAALPQMLKKYRLLQKDNFVTTAGQQGVRAIVEDEQGNRLLRQTFYFFGKESTMFTITCTALVDGGEKFDSTFETSMKTFRFDSN